MNISVVISTILIAQVSASFFDVFQGAVLSVQNSVGKLISDVAFDVRETVDCTILAVEHVLSLSDDATSRYYDKCGSGKNKTESENNAQYDGSVPKVQVSLEIANNEEYLRKVIPAEIDARINETLKKVLGSYDPSENLLSVQNVLAKESEQLADVGGLIKQELEKLTNEVNSDFKYIKAKESEPSVDTILQGINLLENREKITKNTSEANEIHEVIDEVLDKLDVIEATEATENLKLEEILIDLENNSNNTFVGLRQQFEEWKEEESRHLDEIKNKMEEHEKNAKHSKHKMKSNYTQPVAFIGKINDDIKSPKIKGKSLYPETVQQVSKDNDSNEIPFSDIPNSTQTNKAASATNIAWTNAEQDRSEPSLNTQDKDTLDSPTTSRMVDKNEELTSLTTIIAQNIMNDNVIMDIPFSITESSSKSVMTHPIESTMDNKNEESSTLTMNELTTTLNILNELNSNDTAISSTPLPITGSATDSEIIHTVQSTTDSEKDELPTSTTNKPTAFPNPVNDSDLNDTIIIRTADESEAQLLLTMQTPLNDDKLNDTVVASTAYAVVENALSRVSVDPTENTTYSGNEEFSTTTAETLASAPRTLNNYDSNETKISNTSSQIMESITVSETIQPIEGSTEVPAVSKANNDDSNDTMIMSTSAPIQVITTVIETTQSIETTNVSEHEELSTLTTNKPATNPNIAIDNDSNDTMIMSTSSLVKSNIAVTESNEPVEITTVSRYEEPSDLTINKPTTFTNTENEDDLNEAMITSTSFPIEVTISVIDTTQPIVTMNLSGNEDPIILIPNKPTASPNAVIETTINSEIDKKEEDTTSTGINVYPSILSIDPPNTSQNTFIDSDSNGNLITRISFPTTESTFVSEMIQPVENTTATENEPATIANNVNEDYWNNTVISPTFPITDSSLVNKTYQPGETITVSINQESSTLTLVQSTTTSETPQIPLHEPETNDTVMEGTLPTTSSIVITESSYDSENIASVKSPSTPSGRDLTIWASLRDPILKIGPSLITKGESDESHTTPIYRESAMPSKLYNQQPSSSDQTLSKSPDVDESLDSISKRILESGTPFTITKSAFNDTSTSTPVNVDSTMYKGAFDELDSIKNHVLHNESPFDIPKTSAAPTIPVIKDIYTPRIYPKKPNHMETPKKITGPPYSFNGPPLDLTTHKPLTTVSSKGINYNNAPLNLNSFFHIPQKNSDAHDRALKEARELIANSKRSERIINSILKNKNNYGRRSIFNNPGPLNAGK